MDAAIIAEDREALETTDPDAIGDMSRQLEMHMPSDRPGMIMRRRLSNCCKATAKRRLHDDSYCF